MISLLPLWEVCFVANDEDEAVTQMRRQIAPYEGKTILVDRLTGQHPDHADWLEFDCGGFSIAVQHPHLDLEESQWEDDSAIGTWHVRPVNDEQTATVTKWRGQEHEEVVTVVLDECEWLWTEAPAVGTAEGFNVSDRELIMPTADWWPQGMEPS